MDNKDYERLQGMSPLKIIKEFKGTWVGVNGSCDMEKIVDILMDIKLYDKSNIIISLLKSGKPLWVNYNSDSNGREWVHMCYVGDIDNAICIDINPVIENLLTSGIYVPDFEIKKLLRNNKESELKKATCKEVHECHHSCPGCLGECHDDVNPTEIMQALRILKNLCLSKSPNCNRCPLSVIDGCGVMNQIPKDYEIHSPAIWRALK